MLETLHRILPASAAFVKDIRTLKADNVLKALDEQGIAFDLFRLGSSDWELEASELTDEEILALLKMEKSGHEGELLICTEACTRYGLEPFRCEATELGQFISDYDLEMFFDGDVVIASETSRTLTVYHHAGAYAHVKL